MTGNKLGRYEILEVIGRGGQSIAYRARDPKINRIVAIKQILSKPGLSERDRSEFFARFMREAQAAGRLSHPNIATIYDVGGDEEGEPYIALEYVDGNNLGELIERDHPLLQARIVRLFVQLCSALDYAHNANIVHRDIKPGNIMVTRDDQVKVVDFGIAKMDSSSLTQAGTVIGTPSYMSPEQIMGRAVDRRSDIFSLGVVLYETLSGDKPFKGEHSTSVIYKIVHERHASVLEWKREPTLLPDFDRILDKAMAKAPADRYQSCAELGRILESLLEDARLGSGSAIGRSGAHADVAALSPPNAASADATLNSSGATLSLQSVEARGAAGKPAAPVDVVSADSSDGWSFTISNVTPAVARPAAVLPPPGKPEEDSVSAVGHRIEPATTGSRNLPDASAGPGAGPGDAARAKRRSSILLLAAAAAVVVALVFVVVSQIPRKTASAPPLVAAPVNQVVAATPVSPVAEALANAQAALGQGLIVGRDGKDALHFVTAALALDPANADAQKLKADIRARALQKVEDLRKQGRADDAQAEWDTLLESFPGDLEIRSKHDAARATQSRVDTAAELDRSRKAAEKAFAARNFTEAVRQFGNVTRMDPRNASAFYFLGSSNAAQNNLSDAVKNLTRACELEPRNPTYNIRLAQVLEKNKNIAGALAYLNKGIELGGDRENSTTALKAHASELKFHVDLAQLTPHTFIVKHVHRMGGRCDGQLVVTATGVSFIPDEQKDHAMRATLEDIKRFAIVKNRLEVELPGEKRYSFESAELDRLTKIAEVLSRRR